MGTMGVSGTLDGNHDVEWMGEVDAMTGLLFFM